MKLLSAPVTALMLLASLWTPVLSTPVQTEANEVSASCYITSKSGKDCNASSRRDAEQAEIGVRFSNAKQTVDVPRAVEDCLRVLWNVMRQGYKGHGVLVSLGGFWNLASYNLVPRITIIDIVRFYVI
ncbi:predicted protein [Aspergillus terreus NIH2624]|uniref:Uncharacterized protein n=1 Tax=Aspergillus terreus (strain NIH 2624 / FGSC A1156) TaxID=341663 RepID=Q0CET5_ASPTN|nr:uncharacterized protein ATEG_07799 [Aspergillus terreus NIH2624]EAU32061.1 predicted protein [Aspergillus terreus NIH2624]